MTIRTKQGSGNQGRCYREDHELWREIIGARVAADKKHGKNSIEQVAPDSPRWLTILGEEFGEVCRALTYDGTSDLRSELIDVAAVATAWIDAIDRVAEEEQARADRDEAAMLFARQRPGTPEAAQAYAAFQKAVRPMGSTEETTDPAAVEADRQREALKSPMDFAAIRDQKMDPRMTFTSGPDPKAEARQAAIDAVGEPASGEKLIFDLFEHASYAITEALDKALAALRDES
jgi:hypothetical protein